MLFRSRQSGALLVRKAQCTWQQFVKHLKNYKIRPSVGRTGVCWDNARVQVLQHHPGRTNAPTLVAHPTREEAIKDVASWIETDPAIIRDSTRH